MKINFSNAIRIFLKQSVPFGVVTTALIFSGTVAFLSAPSSPIKESIAPTEETIPVTEGMVINQDTPLPPAPEPSRRPVSRNTEIKLNPSPQPVFSPAVSPAVSPSALIPMSPSPSSAVSTVPTPPTPSPSPSNSSQSPSPEASPSPVIQVQEVRLEIKFPNENLTTQITYRENMNVCDVLQQAKDSGKIGSLTFDDSYLSTFNSKYVFEINGFKNNWKFKVNGESPLGCSLAIVKPNDQIVWEFI